MKDTIHKVFKKKFFFPTVKKIDEKYGDLLKSFVDESNIKTIDNIVDLFSEKTIAIIGNSPNILKGGYGEEIDSHDIVIRINKGILGLDRENTGIKTDILCTGSMDTLLSPKVLNYMFNLEKKIKIIVPFPFEETKFKGGKINIATLELLSFYKKHYKYYLDIDSFNCMLDKIGGGKFPTTGFTLINYILENTNFSKINLYGFTFSNDNRINGKIDVPFHDFNKEEEIITNLSNSKLVLNY